MGKICGSLILLGMLFDTFDAMVIGDGGSCCAKKTVGGVAYTLVSENDTTKYGCKENCIYTRDDQPGGTQFCFKAGDLESVCNPDMEGGYTCLDGWQKFGIKCYQKFDKTLRWNDAETFCQKEGGHLASVHSDGENNFLFGISGFATWIGGNFNYTEGMWTWTDGSAFDYSPSGYPCPTCQPSGGTQGPCITFWHAPGWNDANCSPGFWATKFVCQYELYKNPVLFVDAGNILDLPGFTHRECSIPPYGGTEIVRTGSGVIDGYLMTCGGLDFSNNCYSLQKGSWVKKSSMLNPANGLGASPFPDSPNSLAVSYSKEIDILLPGESWEKKLDFPGSSTLYLHCQAALGPSIIITGGYNKPGEAWSWTGSDDGGSWQKLHDLNHPRFGHACVAFEQTVYLIGGQGDYKPVETYKLGEDKWVDIDSLPINSSRQAFVFDNKLYVIVDNGDVYVLKDDKKSWEKITSTGINFPYSTYGDTFPSQILDASSIGC